MDIKPKELGYIENGKVKHQSNTVYDADGILPTITAIQGSGTQQIKITDVRKLGNIYGFDGGNYAGNVFDKDKISPCLRTSSGGNVQPMIVEVKNIPCKVNKVKDGTFLKCDEIQIKDVDSETASTITSRYYKGVESNNSNVVITACAMRGRNPDNPSDRTAGIPTEQRLEVNNSGCSNCLTTVQKDNLVLEQAECLRMERTEEGKALRKDYESGKVHHAFNEHREAHPRNDGICNTITTVQKDTEIIEIKGFYEDIIVNDRGFIDRKPQISKGISPTLRAETHGNKPKVIKIRQATKKGFIECEIGGVADLEYPDSKTRRGRVIYGGKICPTLTTSNVYSLIELGNLEFYNFLYEIDGNIYLIRIRKLIPLETWRLMKFSDEDFHKAEKVNSNSQLYKQSGNSIVKSVLMALFSQLNIQRIKSWNDRTVEERYELIS